MGAAHPTRRRKGITMYSINLNERELSFLFNLLENDIEERAKAHAWYRYMHELREGDTVITLNEEQRDVFYQDMVCNSEEILRQMGMKVRYHSMDDSSWANSKWCLETISDILNKIQDAKEE